MCVCATHTMRVIICVRVCVHMYTYMYVSIYLINRYD